jgi:hypothetical protein
MHDLEYALFALSVIQEKEKKNPELAEELLHLASVSHTYEPPKDSRLDLSNEYMKKMHKRADHLIHG